MGVKLFSKKAAISHGIKMTKKYFGVIFVILAIAFAIQIVACILEFQAGENRIRKGDLQELYSEPGEFSRFSQHLADAGYISRRGLVEDKLANLKNAAELSLPEEFERDRLSIFSFLKPYTYRLPFPKPVYYVLAFALWVVGILVSIGLTKVSLMLSRDEKPGIAELFSCGPLFIKYVLASICYGLAIMGGLILLIVPGLILMVMLGMFTYLLVDANMGPIESLRASRALTKGSRWQLFLFGGLICLINLGGLLCLVVGMLFTIPLTYIASAYVYDQLRKQEPVTSA